LTSTVVDVGVVRHRPAGWLRVVKGLSSWSNL
jgi:hypothetical protein